VAAVIMLRPAKNAASSSSSNSLVKVAAARGVPEAAACYATPPEGTSEGELAESVGRALRGLPGSSSSTATDSS
jgi:hypothetical protein